ncbi:MAG: hypothetical protein EAZ47_05300 [Bacteroidetes bacterium]|nr:MAG: hypothetical protein EAY72_08465 [Bacteroidota bacterium]TAF93867.1 MAG: hypothetical protein EAZ47_05300 [Bacteroidota bacterium]
MKKYLFHSFIVFIFSFLVLSGKAQWSFKDTKNGIEVDYNFQKFVVRNDTSIYVDIVITDKQIAQPVNYGGFLLNSRNIFDKDSLSNMLKEKYFQIVSDYGTETILRHGIFVEQMILAVKDTLSPRNRHSLVFQGLNIFKSLLDGAKRDILSNGKVEFHVFGGFLNALNSFTCEEEVMINIANLNNT